MVRPLLRAASVLALAASALAASAQTTAYSSFGYPDPTPGPGQPPLAGVGDLLSNRPYSLFASSATGLLSGIQVYVDSFDQNPTSFNVRLYADVPATTPGSTDTVGPQLAAFTGTVGYGPAPHVVSVPVGAAGFPLVAGAKYWLGLDGGSVDGHGYGNVAWYHESGAPTTTFRLNNQYYANSSPEGFSVQVTPVPEPSALAALGLGAVATLRRRKRA